MPYQVNAQLMAHALGMRYCSIVCPPHRGDEVTAELIDGPRSVAWRRGWRLVCTHSAVFWSICCGWRLLPNLS